MLAGMCSVRSIPLRLTYSTRAARFVRAEYRRCFSAPTTCGAVDCKREEALLSWWNVTGAVGGNGTEREKGGSSRRQWRTALRGVRCGCKFVGSLM